MKVPFGIRDLEIGGPHLDLGLRESNDILHDVEAQRQRMGEDGYLFFRGLQDRAAVLRARRHVLDYIAKQGSLKPGTEIDDAYVNFDGAYGNTMGRKGITHEPAVRGVLESPQIFGFFERFFARQATTFDYKWLRCVRRPDFTGAHYDVVYMGRGSAHLYTVWTPFCDIPLELGPLVVCAGSHNLPGYERLRQTYGRMDVDRDRVKGWFSDDPVEIVQKFGGKWKTVEEFRAGDVLIFGMYTMHGSLKNQTDRWRISCDTRFQPADEPIDERWVGENPKAHYAWYSEPDKMVSMEAKRVEWGV